MSYIHIYKLQRKVKDIKRLLLLTFKIIFNITDSYNIFLTQKYFTHKILLYIYFFTVLLLLVKFNQFIF